VELLGKERQKERRRRRVLENGVFDLVRQMMWTVDGVDQVDGKNDGLGVEERGRWKWKGNRREKKVKERKESWRAFL